MYSQAGAHAARGRGRWGGVSFAETRGRVPAGYGNRPARPRFSPGTESSPPGHIRRYNWTPGTMSKKTSKQRIRAAKKRAAETRRLRRDALTRASAAVGAVIVIAVITLLVGYAVRMSRIHVLVAPGVPPVVTRFLSNPETRIVTEAGSDVDAILGPAAFGANARVGVGRSLAGGGAAVVAADPYVLIVDPRAGVTVDPTRSLQELLDNAGAVGSRAGTGRVPLIVAGDDALDFAAFLLYMASETLDSTDFETLRETLAASLSGAAEGARPTDDTAAVNRHLLELLEPVIARIRGLEAAGVLADNWTDLDAAGLADALRSTAEVGTDPENARTPAPIIAFARRSALKRLDWDEGFFLRVVRPPAGEGRLRYRVFAKLIVVTPGAGPRATDADEIAALLHAAVAQTAVETETVYSPVVLEGDPINREHRDVVRAIRVAEQLVAIDAGLAQDANVLNLHRLLR